MVSISAWRAQFRYVHLAKIWVVAKKFKIRTCGGSQRFPKNSAPLGSSSTPWRFLRGGSLSPPDFMKADARAHGSTHPKELLNTTLCRGEPRRVPSEERTCRDTDSTRISHFKENSLVIYHLTLERRQSVGTCTGNIHCKETHDTGVVHQPNQSTRIGITVCYTNVWLRQKAYCTGKRVPLPHHSRCHCDGPIKLLILNSTTPPCHDTKMAGKWWNRVSFSSFW